MGMGRMRINFLEVGKEWKLSDLLYAYVLVLYGESEDLKVMEGQFVEECRRTSLKVNADKIKMIVLSTEERLGCEIRVDGVRLEQVFEFKYLGCILDELSKDVEECDGKVASRRKVANTTRSIVNVRCLYLECA